MDERYQAPVSTLLTYGDASLTSEWPDYPGTIGLRKEHVPELIRMATDESLYDEDPDGPEVWVHAYVCTVPLESTPVPSSVTVLPEKTVCGTPALATGGVFTKPITVMFTVDAALVAPRLSVTTSEKVNTVVVDSDGATNVSNAPWSPSRRWMSR